MVDAEKAIQKINELNPNFTIISDFKGWREDIVRKCNICGDIRAVKARSLIEKNRGQVRGCITCVAKERAKLKRKSHIQFIKELNDVNPNIEVLEEYTTSNTPIQCKCKIDNYVWSAKPHSLLQGHGCPECSHNAQNWGNEERFNSLMKERFPNIIVHTKFSRTKDIIELECCDCGYQWHTSANVILNNKNYSGCPKCNGYAPVSEEEMITRLAKCNPRVEYVSGYTTIMQKAIFKCVKCGNIWSTTTNSVLSGRACPKCNMSHGALEIERVLTNKGIDYCTEYTFDDCRYERPLPFDFYIESKNMCIEYDGEQHFKPVRFDKHNKRGTPEERFELLQIRDNIKTEYCKKNNINLIRIPYTDFNNIEMILNKYIS